MTNHVHLLVTPSDELGPSAMMQSLGRQYVSLYNRKHGRTGTLWEGRFKSHRVETESYLMTLYRYIECNPVRARMVEDPSKYRWSSHRCNAWGASDDRVSPHELYTALGDDRETRSKAYRALVGEALDIETLEAIRACIATGRTLGKPRKEVECYDSDPALTRL